MRLTQTSSGWKPLLQILRMLENLLTESMNSFQGRCLPTTVHHRSTGKSIWNVTNLASFQRDIAAMGYRYQFVTLASFHSVNYSSFDIARKFIERGMEGYSDLQQAEFAAEDFGFSATRHQHEVGVSYFDAVNEATAGTGETSTVAMADSTETAQF